MPKTTMLDETTSQLANAIRNRLKGQLHEIGVEAARDFVNARASAALQDHGMGSARDFAVDTATSGPVKLRLHPAPGSEPAPLVIYFHGGGWVVGSLNQCHAYCQELAQKSGAAVLAIDYPLAPEHPFPAAINASLEVLQWIKSRPAELAGIDVDRIAIAGDSAGGNLATVLVRLALDNDIAIRAQALLYPVANSPQRHREAPAGADPNSPILSHADMAWFWDHYWTQDSSPNDDWRAVPLAADLRGMAPCQIQLAPCDPLFEDGHLYADALRRQGVAVEVIEYSGTFHGFAMFLGQLESAHTAAEDMARFLVSKLR